MAINGGVKFFEQDYALFRLGATATASSNGDSINFILDVNRYTRWESVGSSDATTETIEVTLNGEQTINRIFLLGFNFKAFSVKYFNGATFVDFANVIGVNGVTKSGINETNYNDNSAYYEFDSVTTSRLEITCDKTQVANAQKFLNNFVATAEIGTFSGYPRVQPRSDRNETKARSLSRKYVIQKTYETTKIKINFKTHPFQNDLDILDALFNREEPFLIYPCGGRSGENFFRINQKSWRLEDLFNVQLAGQMRNDYEKGVYTLGFNKSITFEEHVWSVKRKM